MAEGIPEYDELKLRVEPRGEGTYDVVAFAPDGGTATGRFESPISELELDNFVLRVARPRSGVRSYRSSNMEEAKELGCSLFEQLLADDVGDVYHGARRVADSKGRGLRISLSMTGAPELLEIPWELLYDPSEAFFLSQSIYTPVVRSLDLKSPRASPKVTLPLRVLALVSAPQGFVELDIEAERANLERALAPLVDAGAVRLEWLPSATLSELDRRVAAPDELHVIHYIGHGAYDETRAKAGILVLEDKQGRPHEVTGEELGALVMDERSLRLFVLNSCEGARASHVDPFSGVASSLLRCGLPAVIGMQTEITDEAAVTFSDRLYTALAQGFPIDAALAQARRAIFAAGRDVEFGTPVLFMRVADGRIFEVSGELPPPPVGRLEADLRAEPASPRKGGTLTWRLEIRNSGGSELSDVAARDSDGETRVGPLELAAGATQECSWSQLADGDVDETVTVGGRGTDGRLVSVQASAHVKVAEGGPPTRPERERPERWRPTEPLHYAGLAAGAIALLLLAIVLIPKLIGGGGGGGGDEPEFRVYPVGTGVPDLDARGDKVAVQTSAGDGLAKVQRLDLASGDIKQVLEPARYVGIDVGITAAGQARLVYSRCEDGGTCDVFIRPFDGVEVPFPGSSPRCDEVRPTMAGGLVLFAVGPEHGCEPTLMLKPAGDRDPVPIAGSTAGSDLNDDVALWLTPGRGGTLEAMGVRPNGTTTPKGKMKPPAGGAFHAPLVIEEDYAYFIHQQGSRTFIARAKLPLGESKIEHYSPGDDVTIAEESPHYAVTADTLYTTNYPRPDGEPGSEVIVRVRHPRFEPAG